STALSTVPSTAVGADADAESDTSSGAWHSDVPLAVLSEALGRTTLENAAGLNVEQRRALLASLLNRAWDRAAAQGRRVILLDDFQAADPESQAVVAQFVQEDTQANREFGSGGRMLVTAQRELPASVAEAAPRAGTVLPMEGLDEMESRDLLQQRLHGPLDALASDLLLRYSQGNPLYLTVLAEELVNQGTLHQSDWLDRAAEPSAVPTWQVAEEIFGRLQTARCLQRRDGLWRLRADAVLGPADLGLPDSLHRLVLTRLDRLPVSAGLTLRVLAAADAGLDETRLAAAHPDADAARLHTDLNTLAVHGFVRAVGKPGALAYAITNSVVQDVVYESMLDRQRRELHSALAHAYQITAAESTLGDVVEPLAYHLYRGQLESESARLRAGRALEQAIETARTRYALETALGYVDCLLTLAPSWQIYATRFDILHALGLRREQQELLDTLARLHDAPGNEVALCHARYYEAISDYDAAQQWTTRALEIAQSARIAAESGTEGAAEGAAESAAGEIEAYCLLGQIARRRGDFAAAAAGYRAALAVPLASSDPQRLGEIAYGLGIAARHQGNFEEAHQRLQAALDAFHACGSRADEALALTALGVLAQMERRYDAAYTLHSQALDLRRSINDWPGEGSSLVSLAQLRRAQGYHAEAVQLLHGAQRIHRALHDRWWENRILNEIGVIYLIAGMLPAAQRALEEGITLAQAIGDVAGEMVLLLNLGQVLRDSGQLDAARAMLGRSLEMARTRNEVYIQAQCYSDLARTHLLAGETPQALANADNALELLGELGLETAITADLATQAEAYLQRGQVAAAQACAQQIVATLDAAEGEGADFPQRDYWVAGRVFHATQDPNVAVAALEKSRRHLALMAERFQDVEMREAFLTNSAVNRAITAGVWTLDA
ncbi:MAG: tetratricopeptide repeat protein, partial [Litorilinea sp.]